MKVKQHLFSISKNLDSLLVALAGFVLIQIFSKHSGIGISPDSVTYLSASRHLATGGGFRSFDHFIFYQAGSSSLRILAEWNFIRYSPLYLRRYDEWFLSTQRLV